MAIEGVQSYWDPAESAAVVYGIDPDEYAAAYREACEYAGDHDASAEAEIARAELLNTPVIRYDWSPQ